MFHFLSLSSHVKIDFCFHQIRSSVRMSGMWDTGSAMHSDLRSSSSPISTPASRSMAKASVYSSLSVGSRNLKGSLGNCLFTVWISVWKLMQIDTHAHTHENLLRVQKSDPHRAECQKIVPSGVKLTRVTAHTG